MWIVGAIFANSSHMVETPRISIDIVYIYFIFLLLNIISWLSHVETIQVIFVF